MDTMESKSPEDLVKSLEALYEVLPQKLNGLAPAETEISRLRAVDLAYNLMRKLQTPWEVTETIAWAHIELPIAIAAADLDIFNTFANHDGPLTIGQVTQLTKANNVLVERILRFLAAHGLLDQVDAKSYVANRLTKEYTHDYWISYLKTLSFSSPSCMALPTFLREFNYENPNDPKTCPWQTGLDTSDSFWEWLKARPEEAYQFNNTLRCPRSRFDEKLTDVYPFEKLFAGSTAKDVVFVDVGGGFGQQCLNLRRSFGPDRGRVILQDLPQVVEGKELLDIEIMSHDMMQPQPVTGAHVYYFRGVIHDHSDELCRAFLGHIKDAMSEHSRLLVDEELLADENPSVRVTKRDFGMMALLGGMERSESQMKSVLESVGFKVLGQYTSGMSEWKITEASL